MINVADMTLKVKFNRFFYALGWLLGHCGLKRAGVWMATRRLKLELVK